MIEMEVLGKVWKNKGKIALGVVLVGGGAKGAEIYNAQMQLNHQYEGQIQTLAGQIENKQKQLDKQGAGINQLIQADVETTEALCNQAVAIGNTRRPVYEQLDPSKICPSIVQLQIDHWRAIINDIQHGGDGNIQDPQENQTQ